MMETLCFLFTTTFFPPYHIGGDATHVYHLSCELAKRGHEVHVIHSLDSYYWQKKGNPEASQYPIPDNVIIHPLKSPIGGAESVISYLSGIPFSLRHNFFRILKEVKPDILHHHNIAGFGPWVFGLDAPIKLYTAHDHWLICQMNGCLDFRNRLCYNPSICAICSILSGKPPQFWRYTNYLQKNLQNIDTIISPSEYLKKRLIESGISVPITVIPNFIPEPSEPGPPIFNYPYFLFVGVIERHKGILDLVNTFIQLRDKTERKLLIAGNGSLRQNIEDIISRNNFGQKIIMLGRVEESILSNLYSYADALIIPSQFYENCPMVALEALAHGTPIITSDVGGLPEITRKLDPGLIFTTPENFRTILLLYNQKKPFMISQCKDIFNLDYSTKNVDQYLKLILSEG
jgi:glycosyltransferase involved in cell wall biosynthesis